MASFVTCPSCKKKLRLPDLPARIDLLTRPDAAEPRPCKCPSCGTTFRGVLLVASPRPTSSDTGPKPPATKVPKAKAAAPTPEEADDIEVIEVVESGEERAAPRRKRPEPDEDSDPPQRKAKRRRKREGAGVAAWFGQTLLIIGRIHITPTKLMVASVLLIPLVWLAIALMPSIGSTKPTAQAVEVIRTPFRAPRIPGRDVPPGSAVFFALMRGSDVVVTRPNPQGDAILVTLPLSGELLNKVFGSKSMIAVLPRGDIKLLCDGQATEPICLLDSTLKKGGVSWYCRTHGGGVYLEPPDKLSTTQKCIQHDSDWKIQSEAGLLVELAIHGEAKEAQLSWDAKSTGWKGTRVANKSASVGYSWEVKCVFPRPANVKNMQIQVWNEPPQPLAWSE